MILVDANVLIYAYDPAAANHLSAKQWLEGVLSSKQEVGIPLLSLSAFLRIMTQMGLPGARLGMPEAVAIVDEWLHWPSVRLISPDKGHWPTLRDVLLQSKSSGRLVTDAQLAALAIELNATFYTTDRDFARFPGLRWQNPLVF